MSILITSLNEIKSFEPCVSGWRDILKGQHKTTSDGFLFPLVDTVQSNSISDVCWLLGKREVEIKIVVKFAKMCAEDVAYLISSNTSINAAHAATDATDAADFAAAATDDATDAAAYATDAAAYATDATAAATDFATATAYDTAKEKQNKRNKQFLIQCINEFTR